MGLIRGSKRAFKKWVAFDYLVDSGRKIKSMGKQLFTVQQPKRKESFNDAVERLNLDEKKVLLQCQNFKHKVQWCLLFFVVVFGYFIYAMIRHYYHTGAVAFGLSCMLGSLVFRYHFWYYQIYTQKLGTTLEEWARGLRHGSWKMPLPKQKGKLNA